MSERTTILVTGGAGFVGSHFARLAADAGREVVILDDLSGGAPAALPASIPLVVGDIGDIQTVRSLCAVHRVGAVAHFAGKIQVGESVHHPDVYFDTNFVRTLALLTAIRDEGIQACLFSSTAAVYGTPEQVPIREQARTEPVNPYGASKLCVELALAAWAQAYGLRWAALRYFNAAGAHPDGTLTESHDPETHLIPLALDAGRGVRPPLAVFGDDYDTPDGTCIRDYIHVVDLASAHLLALAKLEAGQSLGPINLGTGRGYSVREVIDAARTALGKDVPHTIAPRRAGDPPRLVANPTRANSLLGWIPERSDLPTIVEDALRSRRNPSPRRARRHPAPSTRARVVPGRPGSGRRG
jgi:UDP-glucose-4-epimerase GalE